MKYVRLYGFDHKRTEGQFEVAWNELQQGLPKGTDGGFLLGVSENRLVIDGIALETGQAERSFAKLLTTAGLASIHFSNKVTVDDFARLVRAFAVAGSKAQDVVKQIKDTFGDNKQASIRINEVKFVAADPSTGDVTMAAKWRFENRLYRRDCAGDRASGAELRQAADHSRPGQHSLFQQGYS